jgi:hypothetical protein
VTEQERIRSLADEGKITDEEAQKLLAILEEIDQVDRDISGIDIEVDATVEAGGRPREQVEVEVEKRVLTSDDVTLPHGTTRAPPDPEGATTQPPADLNWVHIDMLAGDLEVRVDESISEPEAEGDAVFEREGDDFHLQKVSSETTGDWVEQLVARFKTHDLKLRIPPGYGLNLQMKAGDVKLTGLPYLKANLLAGDLKADELEGVDLGMSAGDVSLGLRLKEGRHRITATAGDVRVKLLPGSSVRVDGVVSIGKASLKGSFDKTQKGIGERFNGVFGDGEAELKLKLSTGNLRLGMADE